MDQFVQIDQMNPAVAAARTFFVPAMKDGQSYMISVGQILDLLIGTAPGALDTLDELAAALNDDANFAATVTAALAAKASISGLETLTNKTFTDPVVNGGFSDKVTVSNPRGEHLRGFISPGANLANGTDVTNDINFPACFVASGAAVPLLMNHSAGTAELDAAYGTGNGGRFDSSISDGTWHCFVISNGTAVSRGLSKSLDPTGQANYPGGYAHYRRIGSVIRISGAIVPFVQDGDKFQIVTLVAEATNVNPGASAFNKTFARAPVGIRVELEVNVRLTATDYLALTDPSVADQSPDATTVNGFSTGAAGGTVMKAMTNTSAQCRARLNTGSAVTVIWSVRGWIDARGRI